MVTPVDPLVPAFVEAGADTISFHPEAGPHVHRTIQLIKSLGKRAGCVLNPATPLAAIEKVLGDLDLVLVMSVNPGFGGQAFIESQLAKIAALRKAIDALGKPIDLEVDGGVNPETARRCIAGRRRRAGRRHRGVHRRPGPLCRQHQGAALVKVSQQALRVARIEAGQGTPEEKARVMAWDRLFGMLSRSIPRSRCCCASTPSSWRRLPMSSSSAAPIPSSSKRHREDSWG